MDKKDSKRSWKKYGLWAFASLLVIAAAGYLIYEYVSHDWLRTHGVRILIILVGSIAVYIVLRKLSPRILHITMNEMQRTKKAKGELEKRIKTLSRVITFTGTVIIIIIASFMILAELGINIGPLLAGFGIAGVAVGFGAQYLIRDIIGGIFIIVENQYNVGDVVKIGNIAGIVEEINLRRTILRDLDGIVHFVPNGESGVSSNYTREWSRVNLNISVAYGTDLDEAISVINRVCKEMAQEPYWKEALIKTPEVLRVDNLGDSGIDIKILGDTKPIRQWEVMGEIRKRVKKAFDEERIEIPWPHTKIYFGDTKPPEHRRGMGAPVPPREGPPEMLPPEDDHEG